MADIGALEFDEIFGESDNEEEFSGFELNNSDQTSILVIFRAWAVI